MLTVTFFICGLAVVIGAQSLEAWAEVSTEKVEVGVPFVLQISVDGSDAKPEVGLPDLLDVSVRLLSSGPNNSQSITIVNGRTTRHIQRRYIISYELVISKEGHLDIPAIDLAVDGQQLSTNSFTVTAVAPPSNDYYRLRTTADTGKVWVGQPITLTTTWMWQEGLGPQRLHSFSHPVLNSTDFDVTIPQRQSDGVGLIVSGAEIVADRSALREGGQVYDALTFELVVVPRHPGQLKVLSSTVAFEGIASFRNRRDQFGRVLRDIRRIVIASSPLNLPVEQLPSAGRPVDFSGLVGRFELSANGYPTDAKVGDPITLELTVSGSGDQESLIQLNLSHLSSTGDFRVAKQRVERLEAQLPRKSIFRTTVRALHEDVANIPSVRISYFDPFDGVYAEATSKPIPLNVRPSRQVTFLDVEGGNDIGIGGQDIVDLFPGISHNYRGNGLLRRQSFKIAEFLSSPVNIIFLVSGPVTVGIAGFWLFIQRRLSGLSGSRGAFIRLRRALTGEIRDPKVLAIALNDYLCSCLAITGMPAPDLILEGLNSRGVPTEKIDELQAILYRLDTDRYGAIKISTDFKISGDHRDPNAEELDMVKIATESMDLFRIRVLQWAKEVSPAIGDGRS